MKLAHLICILKNATIIIPLIEGVINSIKSINCKHNDNVKDDENV